jgi:hypothetical protein
MAIDEIELKDSGWGQIALSLGIYILGKRFNGFYEVVINELYIPWLLNYNFLFLGKAEFEFLFCYDPM